jgi:putative MATE family efflux protein
MALLVYLALMRRAEQWEALTFRNLRLTMEWTRRILKIGAPAAVTALLRTTSLMGFTGILSRTVEHTAGIASLPIGMTAESIAFMPGFGFSVAASALVGQSLGAKEPRRAERFAWMATWQAVATMTLMGVVFYVFADWFAGLFTQDVQVHALAVSYLRIMAFSEPLLAFGMVLTGALQGAGDTISPTVITVASQWLLRVPLAAYMALTLHMNTHGAWIAMSLSTAVGGLLTIALFRWGRWKKIKV